MVSFLRLHLPLYEYRRASSIQLGFRLGVGNVDGGAMILLAFFVLIDIPNLPRLWRFGSPPHTMFAGAACVHSQCRERVSAFIGILDRPYMYTAEIAKRCRKSLRARTRLIVPHLEHIVHVER